MAERGDRLRMRQRGLNDQSHSRGPQHYQQKHEHRDRDGEHEQAIGRIIGSKQVERSEGEARPLRPRRVLWLHYEAAR
jgi:hypothetical protein